MPGMGFVGDSGQEGPGSGGPETSQPVHGHLPDTSIPEKTVLAHPSPGQRELPKQAGGWNQRGTHRSLPAPGKLLRL